MPDDFSRFTRIPSLPTIAIEALKLFQDVESTTDQICAVIRKDPAIVSKLLKAANSPRFGIAREITDLKRAVTMMGRQATAPLILSFSLSQQSMENSEFLGYYQEFWRRAFMQASAAEVIANNVGSRDFRAECYTTSLLAGIGRLSMLRVEPVAYVECLKRSASEAIPLARLEQERFGFTHYKLSAVLLQQIGLPERCVHAIDGLGESKGIVFPESSRPLVEVTRLANAVASILCEKSTGVALLQLEEAMTHVQMSMPLSAEELINAVVKLSTDSASLFDISPPQLPTAADLLQDALDQLARMAAMAADPERMDQLPSEIMEENGRLKRRVADLLHVSKVDSLTGLCNRACLLQELSERSALHRLRGLAIGLAVIDIDHFKKINDTYGHLAGDEALKVVAATIRDSLRDSDVVGRWGGEEFVAILKDANPAGLAVVGERIRSRIQKAAVEFEGQRIPVTASIGLAEGPVVGAEHEFGNHLFSAADAAMYRAKKSGRNCFVVDSLRLGESSFQSTECSRSPRAITAGAH